jgi:methionyl aminopeptidase
MSIPIKTKKELEIMRQGGRILAEIVRELKNQAKAGITTLSLNELAEEMIKKAGAKPAFKGYAGFPAALCASVNEEIVHAVPSERILQSGDILSLDLGVIYQGFYTDMAATIPIGEVEPETGRLIRITKKALRHAVSRMKEGKTLGDVSHAIQTNVERQGFAVVKDLCGHGVGKKLHEEPEVLNYGQRHKGPLLKEGMVFAIEPMVVMGKPGIKKGKDGFSYVTIDGSLSAHFEHTIVVAKKGGWVLTE